MGFIKSYLTVVSRPPITARHVALVLALLCGAGAFAISFHSLSALAYENGIPDGLSQVWALVVDVAILGGTVAHMAMPDSWYARAVFFGAAAVSIAGNVVFAWQFGAVGVAVAVFPPVALLALVHLCVRLAVASPGAPTPNSPAPLWISSEPGPNLADGFGAKRTRPAAIPDVAVREPATADA